MLTLALGAFAYGETGMKFVGKSNFSVSGGLASVDVESDTIVYIGGRSSASFIIPSMSYNMGMMTMTIPSFQIDNTTFTGGYGGVTWPEQPFSLTASDGKAITGTSLSGTFTHGDGLYNLQLTITFIYGNMPMPITYTINGYYVKETAGKLDVSIGGAYNYSAENVTYATRLYKDGEAVKMDVAVPAYALSATMMGDLTVGSYTVKGLTYDAAQGGYFRDYSNDGLTMFFSNGTSMNKDYDLNKPGHTILVKLDGTTVTSVVNNFQPGNMPFPITSTFPGTTSAITAPAASEGQRSAAYNLSGQQVSPAARGVVIINGKKYLNR